jgi:hypothetical protein
VWKQNLALQIFLHSNLTALVVHRQSNEMSDQFRQLVGVYPAHGKNTPRNSLLVPNWDVCARDDKITEDQVCVWAELARVGLFAFVDALVGPYGAHDVHEAVDGVLILWKVCGGRENMGQALEVRNAARCGIGRYVSSTIRLKVCDEL